MERRLLVLLAETPVHAGGAESVAAVDLPIQREATTGLPVIWGQSLKGALRQAARDARWEASDQIAVFGSPPPRTGDDTTDTDAGDRTLLKGLVSIGDAQLLLLPAPTARNTFAWVTSPLLLSRLARKARLAGVDASRVLHVDMQDGRTTGTATWTGKQVLGAFLAQVAPSTDADRVGAAVAALSCPAGAAFDYTRAKMTSDVLATDDTTMAALATMGTDLVARVQLNEDTKTVAHGPFYSEHLPAETVLAAVLTGHTAQPTSCPGCLMARRSSWVGTKPSARASCGAGSRTHDPCRPRSARPTTRPPQRRRRHRPPQPWPNPPRPPVADRSRPPNPARSTPRSSPEASMPERIDQTLALAAARAFDHLHGKPVDKELRTRMAGLPAMIHSNGLATTCAFLLSRAKNDVNDPYRIAAVTLMTAAAEAAGITPDNNPKTMLTTLSAAPAHQYALAETRARLLAVWLSRLARALAEVVPADPDGEST